MTPVELERDLRTERRGIEAALRRLLNGERGVPIRLKKAMAHSLYAGGKRLRPVLLLWTWDAVTVRRRRPPVPRSDVLQAACAVEMLHTYSLIHDDLPAMDDDRLRRGRPTCHVAFDEATAILAGDGLQSLGFSILARSGGTLAGELVRLVAEAAGPAGMVGGQARDLAAEGLEVTASDVRRIHTGKTARLLMAAVEAGALLGGARARLREDLAAATRDLGLAFQGADDVLDCTAADGSLGKTPGKDAVVAKATWVRVEGLARAQRRARRHGERGIARLEAALPPGRHRNRLLALGYLLWNRDR